MAIPDSVPTCWECGSADIRSATHKGCWNLARFSADAFVGLFFGGMVLCGVAYGDGRFALAEVRQTREILLLIQNDQHSLARDLAVLRMALQDFGALPSPALGAGVPDGP